MRTEYFFKTSFLILFLLFVQTEILAQTIIKMEKRNGVYTLPCSVNGLNLRFILDTGAGDVSISLAEASFMLKHGYLKPEDIIGRTNVQIADGSIMENTKIILKIIEIGGIKLSDIEASVVHNLKAPLLLGQSVLQKIGRYQIDGENLIIYGNNNLSSFVASDSVRQNQGDINNNSFSEITEKLVRGQYFHKSENHELAAKYYLDAIAVSTDLAKEVFELSDYRKMGESFFYVKKYEGALVSLFYYIEQMGDDLENKELLKVYSYIIQCAMGLNAYNDAIHYCKKYIDVSEKHQIEGESILVYFLLGGGYYLTKQYPDAIDALAKSFRYYYHTLDEDKQKLFDKGKTFKDDIIGDYYYRIALCFMSMESNSEAQKYLKFAKNFGCKEASELLNEIK